MYKEYRISVYDMLTWLSKGMTTRDTTDDFPELNENDIYACLAYAADRELKLRHVS